MPVTHFDITRREPYEGGRPFGDAGPYERIDGVLHLSLDPLHPANAGIVDIERAARDADGAVRLEADVTLLQPLDPARANGRLLSDIVNRGGRTFLAYNLAARSAQRPDEIPAGDGFLMRRGWTIAMIAWQWDVPRVPGLLAMQAPEALEDGRPIAGWVRVPYQPTAVQPPHTFMFLSGVTRRQCAHQRRRPAISASRTGLAARMPRLARSGSSVLMGESACFIWIIVCLMSCFDKRREASKRTRYWNRCG